MPPESPDLRASLLINKRWRDDPVLFVLEMFGIVLDAWQVDVINVYHKHNRIALKASKGPGKSFLLACICWHFLVTRDHPNIAAISESRENLRDGLWKEMARLQKMSRKVEGSEKRLLEMMFEVTAQRVALIQDPENWFMSARGWKRDADAQQQSTALAGLHAEYCMFILDEAGGIPDAVAITAEAVLATGTECHVIIAGNPTHLSGPLWRASTKERDMWHVVEINGDPDNPKRAPRVKIEWAREQIKRHGRDNPWVKVNVFGEFPPSSINALLGPDEVQAAMRRKPDHDSVEFAQKRLGVDTARFGDDACHDEQTEVLTDEGWKLFPHLRGDEKVLALHGDVSEWGAITAICKYPFDGELNVHESSKVNFAVTDNHRFIVRSHQKSNRYVLKAYRDLPGAYMVRAWNGWSGSSPCVRGFTTRKKMPNGGHSEYSHSFREEHWASFLGWFLSEGNVYRERRDNARLRIVLAQKIGAKRDEMQRSIDRLGIKWRRCSNGMQIEFTSKSIGEHLLAECGHGAHNKRIPRYIKDGSPEVIRAFLDAFLLGDGSKRPDGNGRHYVTSSRKMSDDIQEMLCKIGRAGKLSLKQSAGSTFLIGGRVETRLHDVFVVYERTDKDRGPLMRDKFIVKAKARKVPYRGYVWCITTPHEVFMIRRHGVPMWSGNTVIFPRQGLMAWPCVEMRNARNPEIAARVAKVKGEWKSECEFIDDTGGFGGGVIDCLLQTGFSPVGVSFGSRGTTDPRYFNRRSEMWFELAEWVKRGGSLPDDPVLAADLVAPTYTFQDGKFRLEEKDQIKSRLGRSPDRGDALALTFAVPEAPAARNAYELARAAASQPQQFTQHDFDPLE